MRLGHFTRHGRSRGAGDSSANITLYPTCPVQEQTTRCEKQCQNDYERIVRGLGRFHVRQCSHQIHQVKKERYRCIRFIKGRQDSGQDLFVTTSSAVRPEKGSSKIPNLIPKSPPRQPKVDVASQRIGPVRKVASNIRSNIIQDYDPNVCKDWKRYGSCGFGGESCLLVACLCLDSPCVLTLFLDSCKFLHAQEDYKQDWQLDTEWDTLTKGKNNIGGRIITSADRKMVKDQDDGHDGKAEDFPSICSLCSKTFKKPIITRCGHYFCEPCALGRYKNDPGCAICGAATNGIFPLCQNVIEKSLVGKNLPSN